MMFKFRLKDIQTSEESFNGPFDVLLRLLGDKKLDITKVALSQVTEQYLSHIEGIPENKEEEIADFLVVAARLLLLKSQALLPQFAKEEIEGPSLEEQLKLYKQFLDASKDFNKLWVGKKKSFFRIEPPRKPKEFAPPENFVVEALRESMVQLVNRLKPPKPLPKTHIDKSISVREKISQIRELLRQRKMVNFTDILSDSENRTDVIISFLALLELVKQRKVGLRQKGVFGEIIIQKAK